MKGERYRGMLCITLPIPQFQVKTGLYDGIVACFKEKRVFVIFTEMSLQAGNAPACSP